MSRSNNAGEASVMISARQFCPKNNVAPHHNSGDVRTDRFIAPRCKPATQAKKKKLCAQGAKSKPERIPHQSKMINRWEISLLLLLVHMQAKHASGVRSSGQIKKFLF